LDIKNTGTSTATLYITLGDTGFTAPVTPPSILVNSHIGGTVVVGSSANVMNYWSYINQSNGQNATSGLTPGVQTPSITTSSFSDDKFLTITSLAASYSLTERFAITLGAGAEINFSSSTTLTPVPEPSTMALAGLGALGLIGYGLRRRKALGA